MESETISISITFDDLQLIRDKLYDLEVEGPTEHGYLWSSEELERLRKVLDDLVLEAENNGHRGD